MMSLLLVLLRLKDTKVVPLTCFGVFWCVPEPDAWSKEEMGSVEWLKLVRIKTSDNVRRVFDNQSGGGSSCSLGTRPIRYFKANYTK